MDEVKPQDQESVAIVACLVILLVVAAGVLWVDLRITSDLRSQFRSGWFPRVPGRVLRSNVVSEAGAGKRRLSSHTVDVAFQYTVNGKTFEANTYRFPKTMSHREEPAREVVAGLPPGQEVEVSYDPANPAEAVLSPGLNASDFVLLHLLFPFNCFLAFAASVALHAWLARRQPAGGAPFSEGVDQTRIRIGVIAASDLALIVTALVSLGVAGILLFIADVFVSPVVAAAAWATVPITFVGAYLYFKAQTVLVLDTRAGTIALPRTRELPESTVVPWSEVTGVDFSEVVGRDAQGAPTGKTHAVTLTWSDKGHERTETLVRWESRPLAKSLFLWLRPRIMQSTWVPSRHRDARVEHQDERATS